MAQGTFRITTKITGLQNILSKLDGKQAQLLESMKEGVNMGAAVVEARAKEIVPVRSGNLMRSIFTEFKDDGLTAWIGPIIWPQLKDIM